MKLKWYHYIEAFIMTIWYVIRYGLKGAEDKMDEEIKALKVEIGE